MKTPMCSALRISVCGLRIAYPENPAAYVARWSISGFQFPVSGFVNPRSAIRNPQS